MRRVSMSIAGFERMPVVRNRCGSGLITARRQTQWEDDDSDQADHVFQWNSPVIRRVEHLSLNRAAEEPTAWVSSSRSSHHCKHRDAIQVAFQFGIANSLRARTPVGGIGGGDSAHLQHTKKATGGLVPEQPAMLADAACDTRFDRRHHMAGSLATAGSVNLGVRR